MALAAPAAGAEALAKVEIDLLFTDPPMRAAAHYIAAALPGTVVAPQEPELAAVISDLTDRVARGRAVGGDEVEHARLVLENEHVKRELNYARRHGGAGIPALKAHEQRLQAEIRAVVARLEQPH